MSHPQENLDFHPDFNYEDGSIILVAEDKTAFKVHKGVLCQHSSVFRDMTALPLTSDTGTSFPDIPVIRLPQDNMIGLTGALKAIYDNRFFDKHLPSLLSEEGEGAYITFLSYIMPIGRKYDFESVLDGCILAMRRIAPILLPDLIHRLETLRRSSLDTTETRSSALLSALHLADAFDLAEFFPSLFYQLIALHTPEEIYELPVPSPSVPGLSWKDKTRCIMGIAELRLEQDEGLRCHFAAYGDCTKLTRTAEEGWVRPLCNARPPLASRLRRTKRIVALEKVEFEKEASGLNTVHCRDCTVRFQAEYEKNQARVWTALPKIFRLAESWDELLHGKGD